VSTRTRFALITDFAEGASDFLRAAILELSPLALFTRFKHEMSKLKAADVMSMVISRKEMDDRREERSHRLGAPHTL